MLCLLRNIYQLVGVDMEYLSVLWLIWNVYQLVVVDMEFFISVVVDMECVSACCG